MTKKKENRGGRREGAGRKPIFEIGEQKRRQILMDIDAEAEERGSSMGRELAKMMFSEDKRVQIQALQLVIRDVLPKVSERDVTVTEVQKPQIYLPEELPDAEGVEEYSTKH